MPWDGLTGRIGCGLYAQLWDNLLTSNLWALPAISHMLGFCAQCSRTTCHDPLGHLGHLPQRLTCNLTLKTGTTPGHACAVHLDLLTPEEGKEVTGYTTAIKAAALRRGSEADLSRRLPPCLRDPATGAGWHGHWVSLSGLLPLMPPSCLPFGSIPGDRTWCLYIIPKRQGLHTHTSTLHSWRAKRLGTHSTLPDL